MSIFASEAVETREDASNELVRVAEYFFVESDGLIQLKTTNCIEPKERYLRRRVARDERDFIWKSTNGQCYLCKQSIPKLSSWHVEHVVAFSENPLKNDVLGNMLPSCASCNLRKHDRDLSECITTDLTYDLSTSAKDVTHLNTAAKSAILVALDIKHTRNQTKYDTPSKQSPPAHNSIYEILEQIETNVSQQSAALTSVEVESSRVLFKDMDDLRLRSDELIFEHDLANSDCISSGAFGEIYMGRLDGGKFFARRQLINADTTLPRMADSSIIDVAIKIPTMQREAELRSLVQEIQVLYSLRNSHPNIVTFYGWFPFGIGSCGGGNSNGSAPPSPTPTSFGLVLEYCSHSLNMSNAKRNVDPVKVLCEVSSALEFLHSRNCLHRDIKPNNILICKVQDQPWLHATAKICDFGSAKYTLFSDHASKHTYNAGTAAFRPPEVKRGLLVPESDVYSLGVTMYELSMGNTALLGDRDLYEAWERLYGKMRAYSHLDRPSTAEVHACLERFAQRDFSTVALLLSKRVPPSKANFQSSQSQPPPLSPVCATIPAAPVPFWTPTRSVHAPLEEDGDNGTPPVAFKPEQALIQVQEEEPEVFIASSARCRENPSGTRSMKFHASRACRYVAKSSCVYGIPLSEAAEFKHTACKTCGGGGGGGGGGASSKTRAETVEDIELDLSKLAL